MTSSNDNYDDLNREKIKNLPPEDRKDLNADPITGEPGSHPVGTGIGAAGGGAAGAVIGAVGGPVGVIVGGVVGTIAGAAVGHATGEKLDPTIEEAYWRQNYSSTPYYQSERNTISDLDYHRDYKSAYRLGYENRDRYPMDQRFEDVEPDLGQRWEAVKGESRLKWEQAKEASRDAWNKLTR